MNKGKKRKNRGVTRREFIKCTAAMGTAAAVGSFGFPNVLRGAQPPEILVGHIHPLSGFLGFDGQELKKGLMLQLRLLPIYMQHPCRSRSRKLMLTQTKESRFRTRSSPACWGEGWCPDRSA